MLETYDISKASTHLKGQKWHNDGHPADRHGDVSSPLLGDDVDGAEEKDRPDDVVKHNEAQEGHEYPQRDTDHLQESDKRQYTEAAASHSEQQHGQRVVRSAFLTSQGQLMILSNLRAIKMN